MKINYKDLIEQTFDFPQEEFSISNGNLIYNGIDLTSLIEQYGTPLKFTYLPKISKNINRVKQWFREAIKKHNYTGNYFYSYCTKSSHFNHVISEVLKNDTHLETSSAFDIDIIKSLKNDGKISNKIFILCNGFKRNQYISNIVDLIESGYDNCIPIIDNYKELNLILSETSHKINIGIRIASEEEPKFEFYTSRLGIGYKNILSFYRDEIEKNKNVNLKMLHFFINT
jgi:arginine decarboxylase